jgi:hypothetical protein
MTAARALLIGIPKYDSPAISDLPFIESDIVRLSESLHSCGYETQVIGTRHSQPATRGAVLGEVHAFCRTARQDETLLVTFSGHGVHLDGKDYLVPADATVADEIFTDLLVPVDFARSVQASAAASILFFIDACREGVELGTMSAVALQRWSEGVIEHIERQNVGFIFSCTAGEVSRFVSAPDDQYSLFSRALADVLKPETSRQTFGDFRQRLQNRLDVLARNQQLPRQTVRIKAEESARESRLNSIILVEMVRQPSGLSSPTADISQFDDVTVTRDDAILFDFVEEGRDEGSSITPIGLLRASHRLQQPVGRVRDRMEQFAAMGIQIPEADLQSLEELTVSREDLILLSRDLDAHAPWVEGQVSISHLLRASSELQESLGGIASRIGRFEPIGVTLPSVDLTSVQDQIVSQADGTLLTIAQSDISRGGIIQFGTLLRGSAQLQESLGDVRDRIQKFTDLGFQVVDTDLGSVKDIVVDRADLLALGGDSPWSDLLSGPVSVAEILQISNSLHEPMGAILDRLRKYDPVVIQLPEADFGDLLSVTVPDDDANILGAVLGHTASGGTYVTISGVLQASYRFRRTIGDILSPVHRYEPTGIEIPGTAFEQLLDEVVSEEDLTVLSRDLDKIDPWLEGEVSVAHMLRASSKLKEPISKVRERLKNFEPIGLIVPDVADSLESLIVSENDLIALGLQGFGPHAPRQRSIWEVLQASSALDEPVRTVLDRIKRFEAAGFLPPEDDLSEEVLGITVTQKEAALLGLTGGSARRASAGVLTTMDLLRASQQWQEPVGQVREQVSRFHGVGVAVPEAELSSVEDVIVSEQDLVALSRALDGGPPWVEGRISGVHLLRASSKLQEPVGQVRVRLLRFAQALGLDL